jgi:thymidylate synthase (FAD)
MGIVSEVRVEMATPEKPCDDTIVDGARISFDLRASQFTKEQNDKLRRYLFSPRGGPPHWSPFAKPRFAMKIKRKQISMYQFLLTQNLAGFSWEMIGNREIILNGSLWAWHQALPFIYRNAKPELIVKLLATLKEKFPHFYSFAIKDQCQVGFTFISEDLLGAECVGDYSYNEYGSDKVHYESLRIQAPIFVARQLAKHQVHLVWNEVSRRYVRDVPELFYPEQFHQAPEDSIKQGSSAELYSDTELLSRARQFCHMSMDLYQDLINNDRDENGNWKNRTFYGQKMAPEEARMFLPQNMMTSWYWTGSIDAFNRVLKERLWKTAQKTGTQEVAVQIRDVLIEKHGSRIFAGY